MGELRGLVGELYRGEQKAEIERPDFPIPINAYETCMHSPREVRRRHPATYLL
jgi:hypothetical protein